MEAKTVARAIGVPLKKWPGNCYGIACMMLGAKLVEGRAAYGHYHGPVSPRCEMFHGRMIVRHGWIITKAGGIVDPTRFVFEAAKPYIFESPVLLEDYDEGGQQWLRANLRPAPPFDRKSKHIYPPAEHNGRLRAWIQLHMKPAPDDRLSMDQIFWLANLPVDFLGEQAKPMYEWLISLDCEACIPLDNRVRVLESEAAHG